MYIIYYKVGIRLEASYMSEPAKPHEQGTHNQKEDGELKNRSVIVTGQEEEENTAEQHTDTNSQESTQAMFKGCVR